MARSKTNSSKKVIAATPTIRRKGLRARMAPVSGNMFPPSHNRLAPTSRPVFVPPFRGKGRRPPSVRKGDYDIPPIVAASVDPFSEEANGLRYPDEFQGLSGCFDIHEPGVIASQATVAGGLTDLNLITVVPNAGQSLLLFNPDPSNFLVGGVCGTKTTGLFANVPSTFYWPNGISYTGAALSQNAFGPGSGLLNIDRQVNNLTVLRQMYTSARLVSGGVKIVGTQNFSTVSGVIHVAPVFVSTSNMTNNNFNFSSANVPNNEMRNGWQPSLPSSLAAMAQLPGYQQYPMSALEDDALLFTFKRSGSEALDFKPTGTAWGLSDGNAGNLALRFGTTDLVSSYGHYSLCVFIEGALTSTGTALPTGTALSEFEVAYHFECQPNPFSIAFTSIGIATGSAGTQLATRADPNQPLLMAAADNLESGIPSIRLVDDAGVDESSFMAEVERLWGIATRVVTSLGPAVNVIGPLLASMVI